MVLWIDCDNVSACMACGFNKELSASLKALTTTSSSAFASASAASFISALAACRPSAMPSALPRSKAMSTVSKLAATWESKSASLVKDSLSVCAAASSSTIELEVMPRRPEPEFSITSFSELEAMPGISGPCSSESSVTDKSWATTFEITGLAASSLDKKTSTSLGFIVSKSACSCAGTLVSRSWAAAAISIRVRGLKLVSCSRLWVLDLVNSAFWRTERRRATSPSASWPTLSSLSLIAESIMLNQPVLDLHKVITTPSSKHNTTFVWQTSSNINNFFLCCLHFS